jgi:hypothetical protein
MTDWRERISADFRGGVTCLIDTQLSRHSWTGGQLAVRDHGESRSGGVRDTPDERIDRPATGRPVSVASAQPPSAADCEPVCSGGQ